jgi:hypothetical protein
MPAEIPDDQQVFTRPESAGSSAFVWLLAGLGACGIAVLGFVASLLKKKEDTFALHFTTTVPLLGAIAAFTRALSLASTPREVVVDPDGLTIFWRQMRQDFEWAQIGWSKVVTLPMGGHRRLVLFDPRGKTIAKIDEGIGSFDRLTDYVQKKINASGAPAGDRIRTSKNRRSAVFTGLAFGFFFLLSVLLAVMTRYAQLEAAALQERGVQGDATIVRRFLAPNGVTPRLEYRVDTADVRSGERNAAMFRRQWDALAGQATVPVVYDPDNPANSRLLDGEDREGDIADQATSTYLLCAGVGVFCLGGLVYAFFRWNGWTLGRNDNDMPSIVRSGDAG